MLRTSALQTVPTSCAATAFHLCASCSASLPKEDELVIDEDLHRRLCKYLNIASDELDFDKERAGFGSLEPRSRTTTVRLSPP